MSKINIYTVQLAKENFAYIISFIIFIILIILIIPIQIKKYQNYKQKIVFLQQEINDLIKKNRIINSINFDDSNTLVETLNTLVPNTEDYFTIFSTLDNLSAKTGFKIVSYSVKLTELTRNKIVLKVNFEGSPDSFLKFLESYQYGGGRLITMDQITFSPVNYKTTLTLNFYTKDIKKINTLHNLIIDKKTLEKIKVISKQIESNYIYSSEGGQLKEITYPSKQNPFM